MSGWPCPGQCFKVFRPARRRTYEAGIVETGWHYLYVSSFVSSSSSIYFRSRINSNTESKRRPTIGLTFIELSNWLTARRVVDDVRLITVFYRLVFDGVSFARSG